MPQFDFRSVCCRLLLCSSMMVLAACTDGTVYDDDKLGLTRDDYQDLVEPPPVEPAEPAPGPAASAPPPIPQLYDVLSAPPVPELANDPRVSISVNESIPLKDVLFELGRQAGVDMEIDPRIEGGIVFSARERPFADVVRRIGEVAGLRTRIEDNAVRVELDEPYLETYRLATVAQTRELTSSTSIDTGVASGSEGTSQGIASEAEITITSSTDLFGELETALDQILQATQPRGLVQEGDQNFTIGRQTGVVTVFGTARQQEAVKRLIDGYNQFMGAQVLIDARIIEVTLDDAADTGIDWNSILEIDDIGTLTFNNPDATIGALGPAGAANVFELAVDGSDVDAVIRFAERFGTVRTLSSPRLTVLNNQSAMLKVAENFVYFRIEAEIEQNRDNDGNPVGEVERVFTSTLQTVPIGFLMSVQPAIDLDRDQITLTIRPTVTQISSFVPDPAVSLVLSENDLEVVDPSSVPVIDIREIDSVMRLGSGNVAVLGGLMQQRATITDEGIPRTRNIPLVNMLTGQRENRSELVELVILLRATIVENPPPDDADRRLYDRFVQDPRPVAF